MSSSLTASKSPQRYDAVLVVSFGGPDGPKDVLPFLENVLRGRNVPRERMLEVAAHYNHLGGKSPINDQNRRLIAALEQELKSHGHRLPIYWGNRNWHPLLVDTLKQMATDGVCRALAFVTSAFSSYSGCRQYRENIAQAQSEAGPAAPQVDKLRVFYNHPGFIEPMIEQTRDAFAKISADRRDDALLVFTAHSIPQAMADGCRYEAQLLEACRLVAEGVGRTTPPSNISAARSGWELVYQSRSGPPSQPWLGPDIVEFLSHRGSVQKFRDVVVVPIGFTSDHLEVLYDLDTEAKNKCVEIGATYIRANTVGTHPRFIAMIRELIEERLSDNPQRLAVGTLGPKEDICPDDCCVYSPRRPGGQPSTADSGQ